LAVYRKKPVCIEAWEIRGVIFLVMNDWDNLPEVIKIGYEQGTLTFHHDHITVRTLEGVMRGDIDDMLVLGTVGEWYPVKDEIFKNLYDRVDQ
jgi:hypothetical protein